MSSEKVLRFIAITLAVLAVIGILLPMEGIDILGLHLRYPSPQAIMEEDKTPDVDYATEVEKPILDAMQDSLSYLYQRRDSSDLRFWLPYPNYFDPLWEKVATSREHKRTIRILHYGDSQIELDHISSRLRAYMQHTFGGGGPGMLPVKPITPVVTVRQSTHGGLTHLASFGDSLAVRSHGNYGPMMQCFRMEGGEANISIKVANSSRVDDAVKQFSRVKLIANNRSKLKAEFTDVTDKKKPVPTATTDRGVVAFNWTTDSVVDAFRLHISGNADLYALLVDADSGGVAVDNIPMRGCSGGQFTLVDEELLSAAYNQMDIGLIILQFGGNSVPYIKTESQISTYCKTIGKQIDFVHSCCPNAKILFVGPSDMSHRSNGEIATYATLPALIDSLAATVTAHGAAYWSIYHAMGGFNSMVGWARQGLAGKDYIHFSQKGADLMGDRLAQAFADNYELYQLEQRVAAEKRHADEVKKASLNDTKKSKSKAKNQKRKKRRKGGRS